MDRHGNAIELVHESKNINAFINKPEETSRWCVCVLTSRRRYRSADDPPEARALVPLRLATRGPDTARFRVFRERTAAHEPRVRIFLSFGTRDGESNKWRFQLMSGGWQFNRGKRKKIVRNSGERIVEEWNSIVWEKEEDREVRMG